MNNGSDKSRQTQQNGDDVIRVERPDGVGDAAWTAMKAQIRGHLDQLVEQVRSVEHHAWCDYRNHDLGEEPCSSDLVDFTSDIDDKTRPQEEPLRGWWGWLVAPATEDLVTLVIEGRPTDAPEGFGSVEFEIPVWHVSVLRDVLEDEAGLDRLNALLGRAVGDRS